MENKIKLVAERFPKCYVNIERSVTYMKNEFRKDAYRICVVGIETVENKQPIKSFVSDDLDKAFEEVMAWDGVFTEFVAV